MEQGSIKRVKIEGLHGQFDIEASLNPRLNILFGRNGVGKTTFLHILANVLEVDIERFCHLTFNSIEIETTSGFNLQLAQSRKNGSKRIQVRTDGSKPAEFSVKDPIPTRLREELRLQLGGRPVYLPAFRSVLEAISRQRSARAGFSADTERDQEIRKIAMSESEDRSTQRPQASPWQSRFHLDRIQTTAYKTVLCREWFGPFVPVVRCPSLWEVSDELINEIQSAQLELAAIDRAAFSTVFTQVIGALAGEGPINTPEGAEIVIDRIKQHLKDLEKGHTELPSAYQLLSSLVQEHSQSLYEAGTAASRILDVYDRALVERTKTQERSFSQITTFASSVNEFIRPKRLNIEAQLGTIRASDSRLGAVISLNNGRDAGLSVLSSGERQVVTLLFSATHMAATDGTVLVDEPELSLHVDWQRIILRELMKQAGNRQIVACTHAPEITAEHRACMFKLRVKERSTGKASSRDESLDDILDD